MDFLVDNWLIISAVTLTVVSVLNAITKRFDAAETRWGKVLLIIAEALSFLHSKGEATTRAGKFKLPGQGLKSRSRGQMPMLSVLFATMALSGCAASGTQGSFDTCQALRIAGSSHQVAEGASGIVCQLLKGEAREKCFKHRATAAAAAKAALEVAGAIAKACSI